MKWSRDANNPADQLEKARFQRAPALKIHECADADLIMESTRQIA